LFAGTWLSHAARHSVRNPQVGWVYGVMIHLFFDAVTLALLALLFAVIYYFAPDVQHKLWRWLTPGSAIGIGCWFVASIGLRIYLHYFNSYALTYGSLGAVIILLTWFYLTGLMLLLGAEINSTIEAAAAERRLTEAGAIAPVVETRPTPRKSIQSIQKRHFRSGLESAGVAAVRVARTVLGRVKTIFAELARFCVLGADRGAAGTALVGATGASADVWLRHWCGTPIPAKSI
jgi:ABC-type multidrug transport system fused ATPase/permease subunit